MKTPIQELIEVVDNLLLKVANDKLDVRNQLMIAKNNAVALLEREKQVIIDANFSGRVDELDETKSNMDVVLDCEKQAEQYYKETFKQ